MFTNDWVKIFLFTISPKDLLDMWEDFDDSSGSMTKKPRYLTQAVRAIYMCKD